MKASIECAVCGAWIPAGQPAGLCAACALNSLIDLQAGSAAANPPRISKNENGSALGKLDGVWLGNYELLEEIARGGMGVVYKARQEGLGRVVAVKLLLAGEFAGDELIRRFQVEARTAAGLQHPNVVPIHEVGVYEGRHFLVMDYIEGRTLGRVLREEGPMAPRRAAGYIVTIARAIHFANSRGILHRDLKPSNIILDESDVPRIMDFGLAKRLVPKSESCDFHSNLTEPGQVLGSLGYMAPEQASSSLELLSPATDVYGLGAVLYHMLTGRPPFVGPDIKEFLREVLDADPPAARLLNPQVPGDLETIVMKCLEKDPAERYPSAEELAADLERFLADKPIRARPVTRVERVVRWTRRNRAMAGFLASMCAVLVLGAWKAVDLWNKERQKIEFAFAFNYKWHNMLRGLTQFVDLSPAELAVVTGNGGRLDTKARRLTVGIYTESDQVMELEQLAPFLQWIESAMSRQLEPNVQIHLFIFRKREYMEEAFTNSLIDIVRIGEGPLVRLRRLEPLILPLVEQISGGKTSVVFASRSSGITELSELKDGTFAAGNPTSSSSGYALLKVLLDHGLHAGVITFTHQKDSEGNMDLVLEGSFDAGVARKDKILGSVTNSFVVLAEFRTTTMPWACRAGFPRDVARAFVAALVALDDPQILGNLPDHATEGFVECDLERFEELDEDMLRVEKAFYGQ